MRNYLIRKSVLRGSLPVPPSKSQTLRAILFGALGCGRSLIKRYLPSPDASAMIEACRLLGARIHVLPDRLEIDGLGGKIEAAEDVIQAGNSGIVLRFIAAIASLSSGYTVVTGDYSIRHQRPVKPLIDALGQLGVFAVSAKGDGYAPVIIRGPLRSGSASLSGEDSQPVSAMLIASAFAKGTTDLHVSNPGELPWILLTLDWFKRLQIPFENHSYTHYRVFGNCQYDGFEYDVPGDWSSAAFPIAAALVTNSELTLENVDAGDLQGDKELVFALQKMGAQIELDDRRKSLTVKRGPRLKGMEIDINHFVDAITILAVIACYAEGETIITNAAIARHKESDRISAIAQELKKMGAKIEEQPAGLRIQPSALKGAKVSSHHDHRVAMSLMVAGLGAEGITEVENTACIAKTYPGVAEAFQSLGAKIEDANGG